MRLSRPRSSLFGLLAVIPAFAFVAFHYNSGIVDRPKQPWQEGYWVWAGEPTAAAQFDGDLLYVEAPASRWPKEIPRANETYVVRRIPANAKLTAEAAHALVEDYKALLSDAGARASIAGLQIDYDSPTGKLDSYAQFLRWIRRELPPTSRLSITALLDWFTSHSDVGAVVQLVDEFVPQFYDAGDTRESAGIAEPIDATKWAPLFNRYHTPYRIGIATFGRIARRRIDATGKPHVQFFRDASALDFAHRRELRRSVRTTPAGETVVHYDVLAALPDMPQLQSRDSVELTFPTPASVQAAYRAASNFGGYCAGVVYFRWPTQSETLTLTPEQVRQVLSESFVRTTMTLEQRDAVCLERRCADLYLDSGSSLIGEDRTIRLRADGALELFVPGGSLQTNRGYRDEIVVNLPAYSGLGKIYLGRAISGGTVHFEVKEP